MFPIKFIHALSNFSAKSCALSSNSQVTKVSLSQKGFILRDWTREYFYSNIPGSGAGRGGGGGGSVRESGGGLGQYGAAQEEEYFFNKRKEQLEKIKSKMKKEIQEQKIKHKDDK